MKNHILAAVCTAAISACAPAESNSAIPGAERQRPSVKHFSSGTQRLYVGNLYAGIASVVVYPSGGTTPLTTITQGLAHPKTAFVAVGTSGALRVLTGSAVVEYNPGASAPSRTITKGIAGAASMAFDSRGNLFVANREPSPSVTVYSPTSTSPSHKISVPGTAGTTPALAIDAAGNVYIGVQPNGKLGYIAEYSARTFRHVRDIKTKYTGVSALRFDGHGDLYVAYWVPNGINAVAVFAPKSFTPAYVITKGLSGPIAMVTDSNDTLYVSNAVGNNVTVYRYHRSKPARVLSSSLSDPEALAIDSNHNLYVANIPNSPSSGSRGWISVFAPGQASPTTLTDSLTTPVSLAVGQ